VWVEHVILGAHLLELIRPHLAKPKGHHGIRLTVAPEEGNREIRTRQLGRREVVRGANEAAQDH
jgi:hypothetical protein